MRFLALIMILMSFNAMALDVDPNKSRIEFTAKKQCSSYSEKRFSITVDGLEVFKAPCLSGSSVDYYIRLINRKVIKARLSGKKLNLDLEKMDALQYEEANRVPELVTVTDGDELNKCLAENETLKAHLMSFQTGGFDQNRDWSKDIVIGWPNYPSSEGNNSRTNQE